MKPVSKPADMYNYQVAAYLRIFNNFHLPGPSLTTLDYTVIPQSIPKENTYLNQEIFFDIIFSGSEYEYLCECKHSQEHNRLSYNSIQVKDSILEFIASEKYRISNIKRDGIFYLFITNCPINKLINNLNILKTKNDDFLLKYSNNLKNRAFNKWKTFDKNININIEWIRNVLLRMIIIKLEDGRLIEASKELKYEKELRNIIEQVSRKKPTLVPIEYRVKNTIRFISNEDDVIIEFTLRGYLIEISKLILNQLREYDPSNNFIIKKINVKEMPFIKNCKILHHPNISLEKSMDILIENINNYIQYKYNKNYTFIIINPGTYDVYCINLEKSYDIISNSVNEIGYYDIKKISNQLPIFVSKFVLTSLVKESMRLSTRFIVNEDLMDFRGINENSDTDIF